MVFATERLRERLILVVLGALTLFVGVSAIRLTHRHYQIARDADRVQEEIASLGKERASLEQALVSFNDLATVERSAREKLNLQKPGEKVVVLLPSGEAEAKITGGAALVTPKESSNPEKWWTYFFGK